LHQEHPAFAEEHKGNQAMATAAHLCEEEEAQPGLTLISVHEESSQCCMGSILFQLLCMKSQNPAFSAKYHKVNDVLLQELPS